MGRGMYWELGDERPKKEKRIGEIYLSPNEKMSPAILSDTLQGIVHSSEGKGYGKIWVTIENDYDEWGHKQGGETIVVLGEIPYTDEQWANEIKLIIGRMENERDMHKKRNKYFHEDYDGSWSQTTKKLKDKIKELKKS